MSRTQPEKEQLKNPAKKFLEWKSQKKTWSYWDKESEKNVDLGMDVKFICLDSLNTVTGYDGKNECSYYSNEVRKPSDILFVKQKRNTVASGCWQDVKNLPNIKFCKTVYAIAYINKAYELVCFKLSGAALGSWFAFIEETGGMNELYDDIVITVKSTLEQQNGGITYNSPIYEICKRGLTEEIAELANDTDKELQSYFKAYFTNASKPDESQPDETSQENVYAIDSGIKPRAIDPTDFSNEEEDDNIPF